MEREHNKELHLSCLNFPCQFLLDVLSTQFEETIFVVICSFLWKPYLREYSALKPWLGRSCFNRQLFQDVSKPPLLFFYCCAYIYCSPEHHYSALLEITLRTPDGCLNGASLVSS